MFVELKTTKGEKLCINHSKIIFIGETKQKTVIALDDGTMFDLAESYSDVVFRLRFHASSEYAREEKNDKFEGNLPSNSKKD